MMRRRMLTVAGRDRVVERDFAAGDGLSPWTPEYHGATSSSLAAVDSGIGRLVLSPTQGQISSAGVLLSGDFSRVDIWVELPGSATNAKYFDVSIGIAPVTDTDNGGTTSWWHASLDDSVLWHTQTSGSSTGAYLKRKIDGIAGSANEIDFPTSFLTGAKVSLEIDGGSFKVYYDDVLAGSMSVSGISSGSIYIHQGEYSNGFGTESEISKIIAHYA